MTYTKLHFSSPSTLTKLSNKMVHSRVDAQKFWRQKHWPKKMFTLVQSNMRQSTKSYNGQTWNLLQWRYYGTTFQNQSSVPPARYCIKSTTQILYSSLTKDQKSGMNLKSLQSIYKADSQRSRASKVIFRESTNPESDGLAGIGMHYVICDALSQELLQGNNAIVNAAQFI